MATIEPQQAELVQRTEALKAEATTIEAKKAEAEAEAIRLQQKQQELPERYAPAIREGVFIGSKAEELGQARETENIVKRMGGDVSKFSVYRQAKQTQAMEAQEQEYGAYQSEVNAIQEQINEWNRKQGLLSSNIESYNLRSEQLSKDIEDYNLAARNFDVSPFITRGHFGGGEFSFPDTDVTRYKEKFPILHTKYPLIPGTVGGDRLEYQLKKPYGGESGMLLASSEEDIRQVIREYYPDWEKSQLAEIQFEQKSAQLMANFGGFFDTPETFASATAPIGTITDVERAGKAGVISKTDVAKIKYLQSGTAQFPSLKEFEKISSTVPYALGEGGLILSSTPQQRELESRFYEKTGQTFLDTDYPTLFKNIEAKDYGTLSGLIGVPRSQLYNLRRSTEIESLPIDINPETGRRWSEPLSLAGQQKLMELDIAKTTANQWWQSKTKFEKAKLLFAGSMYNLDVASSFLGMKFKGKSDSRGIWEGLGLPTEEGVTAGIPKLESAQMGEQLIGMEYITPEKPKYQELLYKTKQSIQKLREEEGFTKGFIKSIPQNTVAMTLIGAYGFGAGLGFLGKFAPRVAKGIGYGAVGIASADIGYRAIQKDYGSALTEAGLFGISLPYAMAGYKVGAGIKIPTRQMFGDTGQWIRSRLPPEPRGEFDIYRAMFGYKPLTFKEPSYSLPGLLVKPKGRTQVLESRPTEIIYGAKSDIVLPQDINMKTFSKANLEVPQKTKIKSMFDTKEIFNAEMARKQQASLLQTQKAEVLSQAQKIKTKKEYAQLLQEQWADKIILTPPEKFTIAGLRAKEAQREADILSNAKQVLRQARSQKYGVVGLGLGITQKQTHKQKVIQRTKQPQLEKIKLAVGIKPVFKLIAPQLLKSSVLQVPIQKSKQISRQASKLISPQISKQIAKQVQKLKTPQISIQVAKAVPKLRTPQITPEKAMERLVRPELRTPQRTRTTERTRPRIPRTPKVPPIKPPKFGLGGGDLMNQLVGKGKKSKAWKVENPFITLKNL